MRDMDFTKSPPQREQPTNLQQTDLLIQLSEDRWSRVLQ